MKKFLPLLLCLALALTACSSPFVTSTIAADQPDPKLELFAEHSRAINMGAPDAYEQDDNSGATRAILTDATIQERNFYDDANDWIKFQASAGHEYTVETWVSGYADTYLYLYSGTTLLAQNDDKNSSDYASVINFTASQNGEYLLKVYSYGGRSGTNRGYTISVTDHNAGGGDDGGGGTIPGVFSENFNLPQPVRDYYRSAYGLSGSALKTELQRIISQSHSSKSYAALWTMYYTTDAAPNGKVWDMYSNTSADGNSAVYWFTFGTQQDKGSGSSEGQFYNREHTWPNSTFGGTSNAQAYSDGHSVTPTDKIVNAGRSNYAYGEVGTTNLVIYRNGSKRGNARTGLGYTGIVFEPIDVYKGDHARIHFYQALRYYNNSSFADCAWAASGARLKAWYDTMLRQWASEDSLSQKEINRNNAVQAHQGNRNPFVDYPELINLISLTN